MLTDGFRQPGLPDRQRWFVSGWWRLRAGNHYQPKHSRCMEYCRLVHPGYVSYFVLHRSPNLYYWLCPTSILSHPEHYSNAMLSGSPKPHACRVKDLPQEHSMCFLSVLLRLNARCSCYRPIQKRNREYCTSIFPVYG
jgi:hypothetical protein